MYMTINMYQLGHIVLWAALLVLIIFVIVLIGKAISALTKLNSVLQDTSAVSGVFSDRISEIDSFIDKLFSGIFNNCKKSEKKEE